MMGYRLLLGSLGLIFAFWGGRAYAANPEHVAQLLTTGDCPGCDLSEISIKDLALQDANLQGANLSGSYLQNVDLTRANLAAADLRGARLNSANLTGANLQDADLSNVTSPFFCDAGFGGDARDPESCVLEFLPFQMLSELCIEDIELAESIAEATFGESTDVCTQDTLESLSVYSTYTASLQRLARPLVLRGANLQGTNLQDADFSGADFSYAVLAETEATGTDFSYVRLFNADVTGLLNADLSDAWDSWNSVGEWMTAAADRSDERAANSEGQTVISAMSRTQQAHYLEEGRFTTDVFSFGLGVSEETDHYRYGVMAPAVTGFSLDRGIVQYAISKVENLSSFLNIVYVEVDADSGEAMTSRTFCKSETTGVLTVSDISIITSSDSLTDCPIGWIPAAL